MQLRNINYFTSYFNVKANAVEGVARTLKNKLWKQFSKQVSYKWFDMLPKIVSDWNNTIHRMFCMIPNDVTKK